MNTHSHILYYYYQTISIVVYLISYSFKAVESFSMVYSIYI